MTDNEGLIRADVLASLEENGQISNLHATTDFAIPLVSQGLIKIKVSIFNDKLSKPRLFFIAQRFGNQAGTWAGYWVGYGS